MFDPINEQRYAMNITLTPAICKEIRDYARRFIGGFGMWIELGQRAQGDSTYYNCLTTGDDMDGDLYDYVPWSGVLGAEGDGDGRRKGVHRND